MKENRRWLIVFFDCLIVTVLFICSITAYIDPFMHFHAPLTDKYYYEIYMDIERNVNDGISRNFDYDSIITGTSMTENFMTTEAETVFNERFIKVPFAGGRYQEIDENLRRALRTHPETKRIIRGIDTLPTYWNSYNEKRTDLGQYPEYLNNDNIFDDVKYLLNRQILYTKDYQMIKDRNNGHLPGITHFNNYAHWMFWHFVFGSNSVLKTAHEEMDKQYFTEPNEIYQLTSEESETLEKNVKNNIIELAEMYPHVEFDYFFTPYSAACWGVWETEGNLEKQIAVEEKIIEMILPYSNIHLYSWDNCFNVTGDLNNYKDAWHYAEWVNSWMLTQIRDGSGRITEDNYQEYISDLRTHYASYDFNALADQEDYEADYYGAIVLDPHICQEPPISLEVGRNRIIDGETKVLEISIDVTSRRALEFYGMRTQDGGKASVSIYDINNDLVRSVDDLPMNPNDNEWHRYVLGLSGIEGIVTIRIEDLMKIESVVEASDFKYKDFTLY